MTLKITGLQIGRGYVPNEEGVSELQARAHLEFSTGMEEDSRVFPYSFDKEEAEILITKLEPHIAGHIELASAKLTDAFNDSIEALKGD